MLKNEDEMYEFDSYLCKLRMGKKLIKKIIKKIESIEVKSNHIHLKIVLSDQSLVLCENVQRDGTLPLNIFTIQKENKFYYGLSDLHPRDR